MCKTSMNNNEKNVWSKVDLNALDNHQGSTKDLNNYIKDTLMQNDDYYKFLEQEI